MHTAHPTNRAPAYPWHMHADWWLKKRNYLLYMLRELTAVFAALWVVIFLAQLPLLRSNPRAWQEFMTSPGWMAFSFVSFVFILYHAWTWFSLMGTVLYFRPGKTPIPGRTIISAMLFVWAALSLVIALIIITPGLFRV
jgi:fumarate reductase subunit C